MTRFGMEAADFDELAELIRDVIVNQSTVKPRVAELRKRFLEMKYCFTADEFEERLGELHSLM